ncbi:hypothetical protein ZIOFF_049251 [Zingiber officinale]|uniref:EF-hand domain-containing protein n=2 Tax=Zingiber officinale TaxID=94328 RepID=A0A8J5G1B7_ZINOF|nr:hypothetical protein ZIOFF_052444 [Zingiber officinale]KAG6494232.1 hypothetical protein ZIOFF_049251 [Zingiber officinale]
MGSDSMKVTAEMERVFRRMVGGEEEGGGHGKVSSAELGEALRVAGRISCDEIQRMIVEVDTDGDGYIDFDQFAAFCHANEALMNLVARVF